MVKQFSDMIISPSQSVKGEENGQINILLLGIGGEGHAGGQLTDTIMVLSIKPQTHEAALLSIPRDLYVEVQGTDIKNKINAVKELGDASAQKNGIELLENTVEDVSGLHIDYYVQLDFGGFTKIVDTVGGLDVYLENDINDPAYPDAGRGYDPFYIQKGWHHLDGATALKVARSRHSTMGDFDRIKRQQAIIKAFRQKIYEKYSSADILALSNIFLSLEKNMKTDIQPKELPRFYQIVKGIKNNNFTATTVDTQKYLQKINVGLGYTLTSKSGDYKAINELGNDLFNMQIPENKKEAIQKESALIAIKNGTGSPDIANQIAGDLENMGFRIINSTNIETPDFGGVEIDYPESVQKPETLKFLTDKFSAKTSIMENENSRADFVIILGKGF
jgi:LCP family protein required for cell wall assembly